MLREGKSVGCCSRVKKSAPIRLKKKASGVAEFGDRGYSSSPEEKESVTSSQAKVASTSSGKSPCDLVLQIGFSFSIQFFSN
jgi:hypothetical protein